jgi:SOS-response transcriptional repressor LexA
MQGMTPKQSDLLRIISVFIDDHGHSPTLSELKSIIGIKSQSGIHGRLCALRDRGLIVWHPSRARSIKIVEENLVIRDYLQSRINQLKADGAPHDRIAVIVAELAALYNG